MTTMYSTPEKFGLETIGEIDFSDGEYQFRLTVVWRNIHDGKFYYSSDSGCSCPAPFEEQGLNDLSEITSLNAFGDLLYEKAKESEQPERCAGERLNLLERLRNLGLR